MFWWSMDGRHSGMGWGAWAAFWGRASDRPGDLSCGVGTVRMLSSMRARQVTSMVIVRLIRRA